MVLKLYIYNFYIRISIYIENFLFIFASSSLKPWISPCEITIMFKFKLIILYNKYVTYLIPKEMVYNILFQKEYQ